MRATKFIPLDNVNFDLVGDTELEQMDFSKAMDKVEVTTGSVIGFENQDGRRGNPERENIIFHLPDDPV